MTRKNEVYILKWIQKILMGKWSEVFVEDALRGKDNCFFIT